MRTVSMMGAISASVDQRSFTVSPEFGPGGMPNAGSTPCVERKSARTDAGSTAVPSFSCDPGRGVVTVFAR